MIPSRCQVSRLVLPFHGSSFPVSTDVGFDFYGIYVRLTHSLHCFVHYPIYFVAYFSKEKTKLI